MGNRIERPAGAPPPREITLAMDTPSSGELLMRKLEEKGITFSNGETTRETVVGWLNNPYSGYIPLAKTLIKLLSDKTVRTPGTGPISLTDIKGTFDQIISQNPSRSAKEAVKEAFVYRWNEKNGGARDLLFDYIAATGSISLPRYEQLSGESLMAALESKNITFSDGDIPRETIVKWLNDPFSGYQAVARDLLAFLENRGGIKTPSGGRVSITTIKASIDAGNTIEEALLARWNEKNGGARALRIEEILTREPASSRPQIEQVRVPQEIQRGSLPPNYLSLAFSHWKSLFLGSINGDTIVVDPSKPDNTPDKRPSEGIGYGMIFSAWFNDSKTFDSLASSLYKYYISSQGPNKGLPAWGISRTGDFMDSNSATDADFDIAISLIKRYRTTGNIEYKTKALLLLQKIREKDVTKKGNLLIIKPSSGFGENSSDGSVTINPSYFAVGYFDVFAEIDRENAGFWRQLKTDSYKILEAVHNKYGKFPDWARIKVLGGETIEVNRDFVHGERGEEELYDGIRTYWRIAVDFTWNRDERAVKLLSTALRGRGLEGISFDGIRDHSIGIFMLATASMASGNQALQKALLQKTNDSIRCSEEKCFFQLGDSDAEERYYNQSLCLLAKMLIESQFTRP